MRSRVILTWTVLAAGMAASAPGRQQPPPRFVERVDVARLVVDARVVNDAGEPIHGLTAHDFTVKIDGKAARVESATWVGVEEPRVRRADEGLPLEPSLLQSPQPGGRLVVFLFQKSLESSRIVGLMRMLRASRSFLDTLQPEDRVAVLSFDSHLRIWTDFTSDRARLAPVLERGVLLERPPPVQAGAAPSLVERLDPARGKRANGIERALQLIGDALEPLPGAKSIVLFGHGMGRLTTTGVMMEHDYEPARRALVAARASVFSLDVTDADYHSLEAGLQLVSEATGGFYARTHIFPALVMRRLAGALAGSYVLFVDKPERPGLTHAIDVELVNRKGTVLARSRYEE
jgi:VWFA-related protein